MTDWTVDELISVCIARQVQDGEVWAQGINTPLVMAGLILAKLTHAPNVRFASAIGQSIVETWAPLGVGRVEDLWLGQSLVHFGFAAAAADLLPKYQPKEFFRPAQVDSFGNFNNIGFGRDMRRPRLRLPGSGGIPDVTAQYEHARLYVPRHSRVIFTEPIDCVSGVGHDPARRVRGAGPSYCVTDLGEFDWAGGRMRLLRTFPCVAAEDIQRKTNFPLAFAPNLSMTKPPDPEELRLLREVIDPLNVRKLELLGGSARKDLLHQILAKEGTR